jgi:hypothetical protein
MKKILVVMIVILTGLLAGTRSVAQTTKNAVPVRTTDPAPRVTKVQAMAPMKGGGAGGAVAGGATTLTGGQGAKAVTKAGGSTGGATATSKAPIKGAASGSNANAQ